MHAIGMEIKFDGTELKNIEEAVRLEWLETNGLGGWASGTVPGPHTRRYHGLLVPATLPPVGRQVLLSRLDETIVTGSGTFELGASRFPGGFSPRGYEFIESFEKNIFPTWIYQMPGLRLKKTIVCPHGENTTLVLYEVLEADGPITMFLQPLLASRDYHCHAHVNPDIKQDYQFIQGLLHARLHADGPELFLHVPDAGFEEKRAWYRDFEHSVERYRGLDIFEDLFSHGRFIRQLQPGERIGVMASTIPGFHRDPFDMAEGEKNRRLALVPAKAKSDPFAATLFLAADQFIVKRGNDLRTIIAGYHWFSDWGRDTMISLPGLCLVTGRHEDARKILTAFARHTDSGMIPNRFPDSGEVPEYNTVDATLWFFVAAFRYLQYTADEAFIRDELLSVFDDIVAWHEKGTRFGIGETEDGLLAAGEPGVQLTWMDAKVFDWVVTPREGKAVEINALWFNALEILADFHHRFGSQDKSRRYREKARKVKRSFLAAFWNKKKECLFDVIGHDGKAHDEIRPNQLFALSLPHPLLGGREARQVLEAVRKHLLTPRGLRSLEPGHRDYQGRYGGDQKQRDGAYHQGTVWSWLAGPYISALMNAYGLAGKKEAMAWIESFKPHLREAGLGTVSEIFDGEPPHASRGCIAQAWGVAEILRAYVEDLGEAR